MKISEMKRIAEARTKGEWSYYHESEDFWTHFSGRPSGITSLVKCDEVYLHCHNNKRDVEFIAMAANNFEKMLAVVEAAKAIFPVLERASQSSFNRLEEALKALEEK